MSSLFKQINDMAAQQRQQVEEVTHSPTISPVGQEISATVSLQNQARAKAPSEKVKPTMKTRNGTVVPDHGVAAPQLDNEKLLTIVRELAQLSTNSNGLNVRLSEQEAGDIDDFIHVTLRKHGLKGNHVSAAKLMRFAFRYLFRVHETEFIAALKEALKVEEKLSI